MLGDEEQRQNGDAGTKTMSSVAARSEQDDPQPSGPSKSDCQRRKRSATEDSESRTQSMTPEKRSREQAEVPRGTPRKKGKAQKVDMKARRDREPPTPNSRVFPNKSRCQFCKTRGKRGCNRQRPCQHCKEAGIGLEDCVSEAKDSSDSERPARKKLSKGKARAIFTENEPQETMQRGEFQGESGGISSRTRRSMANSSNKMFDKLDRDGGVGEQKGKGRRPASASTADRKDRVVAPRPVGQKNKRHKVDESGAHEVPPSDENATGKPVKENRLTGKLDQLKDELRQCLEVLSEVRSATPRRKRGAEESQDEYVDDTARGRTSSLSSMVSQAEGLSVEDRSSGRKQEADGEEGASTPGDAEDDGKDEIGSGIEPPTARRRLKKFADRSTKRRLNYDTESSYEEEDQEKPEANTGEGETEDSDNDAEALVDTTPSRQPRQRKGRGLFSSKLVMR